MSLTSSLFRIRCRWWILTCVAGLAFFYFLTQAVQRARENARVMSCENNFRQVVLALHNYVSTYRQLPPVYFVDDRGKRMHSWRSKLPGFMEDNLILYRDDEPWDGPFNRDLALGNPIKVVTSWPENAEKNPSFTKTIRSGTYRMNYSHQFQCPNHDHGDAFITDMVAVVGDETAWPEGPGIRLDDITDGTANTILLVEINQSDVLWSEPRDLRFDMMHFEVNCSRGPSISSPHTQGPAVAFADGSVARLSNDIPPEIVKAMLTIRGGEKIDKEELRRKGWLR